MKQLAFIVLAIIIIYCRYGSTNAQKLLTVEQKASFLDVNSGTWQYTLPLAVFFIGFAFISYAASTSPEFIHNGFYTLSWLVLLLMTVVFQIGSRTLNYRRLKGLGLPQAFLKTTALYAAIRYFAFISFICSIFFLR